MSLSINRKIFDRVKTAIAEAGHINMLSWAESRESVTAESVDEIRELPLLDDCQTKACIGGLICHLATSQEIARRELQMLAAKAREGDLILICWCKGPDRQIACHVLKSAVTWINATRESQR